ncbi:hypothetical protein FOL47_002955 [Perkinsus chesapeaki]|uniref:Uncharacterized protein n=1 Tax=Perkinsus chesapeaki TaxID=330153 RepID=A0A7J6MAX6_PERCH|nr:hypothetical protein FOL47_002955 [Perkinsus chesapeaki]
MFEIYFFRCHDFSKDKDAMPGNAFVVAPPNAVKIGHEGCNPLRLLQSAKVTSSLSLSSGLRRIPGIGLGLAIGKDTAALIDVTVGHNMMESIKLVLTKPVALYDIKRALRNYNDIAAKPQKKSFRGKILSLASWGFEVMEKLGIIICLSSAKSLTTPGSHGALRLSFNGFISFAGGLIRLPFRDIVVPEEIIPIPLARLDLVGYFATAAGNHTCVQSNSGKIVVDEKPYEIVKEISELVTGGKFSTSCRVFLPEVEVSSSLADLSVIRTTISHKAGGPKTMYMRADGSYVNEDDEIAVSIDEVKFGEDSPSVLSAKWRGKKFDKKGSAVDGVFEVDMDKSEILSQPIEMSVSYSNPMLRGGVECPMELSSFILNGHAEAKVKSDSIYKVFDKISPEVHITYSAVMSMRNALIDDGLAKVFGTAKNFTIRGKIDADETIRGLGDWATISGRARTDNAFPLAIATILPLPVFPELNMSENDKITIGGSMRVSGDGIFRVCRRGVSCDGSVIDLEVSNPVRAKFLRREVVLPSRSHLKGVINMLHVGYDGLAQTDMVVTMDDTYLHFSGSNGEGTAALRLRAFTLPVRQTLSDIFICLSPVGGIDCGETIIGAMLRPDIRGAVFLNTLDKIKAGEEDELIASLRDDLDGVIKVMVPSLHSFMWQIVDEFKRAKRVLEEEKVTAPLDVIPNSKLGRLLSLLLFKDDSRTERISNIFHQVTEGDGLDKAACRELIEEWKDMFLPLNVTESNGEEENENNCDVEDPTDPLWQRYELDPTEFVLFVLGKILAPAKPIEAPGLKPPKWQDPVSTDPSIRVEGLDRLPSASDLYNGDHRAANVATYLRTAQVAWLVDHADEFGYSDEERRKLEYILSLKRFAFTIFENYGGLAFVPQSRVVGLFLADVVRVEQELAKRQGFDSMKAAAEWREDNEDTGNSAEMLSAKSELERSSCSEAYSTCSSGDDSAVDSVVEEEQQPKFTKGGFIPEGFLHRMTLQMKPVDHEALLRGSLRRMTSPVQSSSRAVEIGLPDVAACRWLGMPFTLLGPSDVASMLASCLAAPWAGAVVQSNTRMLLEMLLQKQQPKEYVIAVLCESSQNGSARALTNILMRLLEIPQDRAIHRIDVAALLEEKLGTDYMAGGKKPRDSYYHALNVLACKILKENMDEYLAVKNRLTVCYRMSYTAPFTDGVRELEDEAIAAIAPTKESTATKEDFENAFAACRKAISADRRIVDRDWCKEFMLRSYESFMVLSVYDEVVPDIEESREWLMVLAGTDKLPDDPVQLVEVIVKSLYRYEDDRERILNDPLTKLMLRNPKGHVKLALVSAMGVISEGAEGTELAETFHRMHQKRGLQIVRADTGTGRSLEYNARRVIEAVRKIDPDTEWGWLGYSQGCANALRAETTIQTGTPEEYELIHDRLVGRMLIFSAFNGSVHGKLGDDKVQAVIMDLEYFMKLLQAHFSSQFAGFALNLFTSALASRVVTDLLVGVQSLTHQGVFTLWRDGQFKQSTPTVAMRGAVQNNVTLPEVLELLSNMLTKQTLNHEHHDTQVTVHECVSHSIHVRNAHTDVFARSGMDAAVQRTHHWSPLLKESAFVTTQRDRERHVYDTAKDRHVEPWVETLIRFGLVPFEAENE